MRIVAALVLSVFLFSCGTDSETYTLKGSAPGFTDGTTIFVYEVAENQPKVIDTITIASEKFTATYAKKEATSLHYLRAGNLNHTILFFPENEDMTATIYKDSITASRVKGGSQNEAYLNYSSVAKRYTDTKVDIANKFRQARQEQDNLLASQLQKENAAIISEETEFKKDFLEQNPNSVFGVMLLTEMVSRKEVTPAEASQIVKNLSPKMAASKQATNLTKTLSDMKKADIGGEAPDFTAMTPQGTEMSLKDALGKYTIIDFWASWCRPCRMENPNVVNVYNKYHDKGLNIISVSLDREGQKARWVKAIEDDKMDWYHVSNLKFWSDPIARSYNVRSIPATFLLDENGVIIGKNLRGAALGQKIESLLGGQ